MERSYKQDWRTSWDWTLLFPFGRPDHPHRTTNWRVRCREDGKGWHRNREQFTAKLGHEGFGIDWLEAQLSQNWEIGRERTWPAFQQTAQQRGIEDLAKSLRAGRPSEQPARRPALRLSAAREKCELECAATRKESRNTGKGLPLPRAGLPIFEIAGETRFSHPCRGFRVGNSRQGRVSENHHRSPAEQITG